MSKILIADNPVGVKGCSWIAEWLTSSSTVDNVIVSFGQDQRVVRGLCQEHDTIRVDVQIVNCNWKQWSVTYIFYASVTG